MQTVSEKNLDDFLMSLEMGSTRAAYKKDGHWCVDTTVKETILALFKAGKNQNIDYFPGYVDKHTIMPRRFTVEDNVRVVPQGSTVRRGAYVAPSVIIMPPSYVNIGAYIDKGSMVDSHVLVGSCAQIGQNVHLSAGVQIGGVLEPIGMTPVIIEDHAFIGAGCVVVDGMQVGHHAVLAPGVHLSSSVNIYDTVHGKIYPKGSPIPPYAVVIPGTRPIKNDFGQLHTLSCAVPIIIKYRDDKTNAAIVLEESLR